MAHDGGKRQRRNEESIRTEGTATRRRYGGISDGLDERTAVRRVFRRGRALTADRRERAAAEISKHRAQTYWQEGARPSGGLGAEVAACGRVQQTLKALDRT